MSHANLDLAPMADASLGDEIPVIDLAEPGAVRAVGEACAEWGFFQIVGHGIDAALIDAAMAETRGFFAQPREAKRALMRGRDNPWGYYDRELTKNVRDKKEIFDIGPDVGALAANDPFSGRTPWPAGRPRFEQVMRAYFAACARVSARLTDLIAESLGAPVAALRAGFLPADTSFLRLNYYPVDDPLGDEADGGGDLGIHHHTDAGALTVLLQDEIRGLQVYRDGFWHVVAPMRGALVVNIGDMTQVWSNDLYAAPVHRVLAMEEAERCSIPFFYNPSYAAVVAPLAATTGPTRPARYRGVPWGEFRRRRADGDFANYGAEVQISDYRI